MKNNKKAVIWECVDYDDDKQQYFIADADDIGERASFVNCRCYRFPDIENGGEELLALLPELKEIEDYVELEDIFYDRNIEFETLNESETPENAVCYDFDNRIIFNLKDVDTTPVYKYWDGSNWQEVWLDDSKPAREIVYEQEFTDIDVWDGSNWFFRTRFNHGRIYRLIEIDGEKVDGEYILYEYTQYQGDLPVISFIDEEAKDRLVEESQG